MRAGRRGTRPVLALLKSINIGGAEGPRRRRPPSGTKRRVSVEAHRGGRVTQRVEAWLGPTDRIWGRFKRVSAPSHVAVKRRPETTALGLSPPSGLIVRDGLLPASYLEEVWWPARAGALIVGLEIGADAIGRLDRVRMQAKPASNVLDLNYKSSRASD